MFAEEKTRASCIRDNRCGYLRNIPNLNERVSYRSDLCKWFWGKFEQKLAQKPSNDSTSRASLPLLLYSRTGCINTCNTSCQIWGSKYSYHKWPNWNVGICPSWEPSWTDCAQGIWLIMSYEMSSVHRYGHEKGIEPTSAQLNGMTWSSFPWMTSTCVSLDKCSRCCAKSKFLSWLFSDVQSEMLSWERERVQTATDCLAFATNQSINQSMEGFGGKDSPTISAGRLLSIGDESSSTLRPYKNLRTSDYCWPLLPKSHQTEIHCP